MGNITLTRRFHAVGQGLFCSETLENACFKHTIVYDCGSLSKDILAKRIDYFDTITGCDKIDILFISHFHNDHTNGILELISKFKGRIDKIVVPQLNPLTIFRALMSEHQDGLQSPIREIIRLRETNTIQIIEIPPFLSFLELRGKRNAVGHSDRDMPNDGDAIVQEFHYETDLAEYRGKIMEIVKLLQVPVSSSYSNINNPLIQYIPFNVEHARGIEFLRRFQYEYPDILVELTRFEPNKLFEDKNFSNIELLYKEVFKRQNEISMSVLSHVNINNSKADCLYTGDFSGAASFENMMFFYKKEWPEIKCLQVPHHGSSNNNPIDLYRNKKMDCFISFGERNKYNHPHNESLNRIDESGGMIHCVTETSAGINIVTL